MLSLSKDRLAGLGEGELAHDLTAQPLSAATSEQVRKSRSSPLKERGGMLFWLSTYLCFA
jgi:hypothetical protein